MNHASQKAMNYWIAAGTRFLPFADAATPDLPLSRLLRLSLFQVAVGMALTLLIGTLNRVMIVELGVPASLVGVMIALPLVFAPFRALIGFKSDTHSSALGWRRVPFVFRGSMVQFGGLAIMPFALLVLSGGGDSARAPAWVGAAGAGLAFLLVGAGLHTVQTAGLALATDLAPQERQPQVVGLMYVMLLFGMIASALSFGAFLADFSPYRLIQVIQAAALLTLILNTVSMWQQEGRRRGAQRAPDAIRPSFNESWARFMQGGQALRRLLVIGLGTMAFSMEDVLLEPYGGQVLHLAVGQTTRLTATLAFGGLFGFWLASRILARGADAFRMAFYGCAVGVFAFAAVIAAGPAASIWLFAAGTGFIGFGAGLFGHGTLTATMRLAPKSQAGLALGAWGAVQATAAGLAIATGGILRDTVTDLLPPARCGAATGYDAVYTLEIALLFVTLAAMLPLLRPGAAPTSLAFPQQTVRRPRPKGYFMKLSRLFTSVAAAEAAVNLMKEGGVRPDDLEIVTATNGWISADTLMRLQVSKKHAAPYAEALRAGQALVLVNPLLGTAKRATYYLMQAENAAPGQTEIGYEGTAWDEAAPLSSALMLPVLIDNPTPFATIWNIPTLIKSTWTFSGLFGLKLLSKNPAPLSSALGMKTLSNNPAPLSSLLKLPVLKK
jgi:BCD family chlorophyll transporter-like MFS transporter